MLYAYLHALKLILLELHFYFCLFGDQALRLSTKVTLENELRNYNNLTTANGTSCSRSGIKA
jgi:hypothetical protein